MLPESSPHLRLGGAVPIIRVASLDASVAYYVELPAGPARGKAGGGACRYGAAEKHQVSFRFLPRL
jgi:hypothetical protein